MPALRSRCEATSSMAPDARPQRFAKRHPSRWGCNLLRVFCVLPGGMEPYSDGAMKTLLRSAQTGLYVKSAQDWTSEADEAMDLKTMSRAIRFADQAGLKKMELAFVSEDRQCPPPVSLAALRTRLSVSNRPD